ncbi:MAG: DUF4270 family protein [Bacteroidetes bacterium]|jgi:hypothetical protein|nr:DUF4270 family protein [Bacteroidota bacterium]
MKLQHTLAIMLAVSALFYSSCTDPALVGADLLDEDIAEVGFTDTFPVITNTVVSDPILTFSPFRVDQLDAYFFGTMTDPVFGRSSSTINVQFYPFALGSPVNLTEFEDYTAVDSVVLILPYATRGFYGDIVGQQLSMEVSPLDELLDVDEDFFSDRTVATKMDPLTEYNFEVSLDTLSFKDYPTREASDSIVVDTSEVAFFHLRVPLPTSFGDSLLQAYTADSTLYENRLDFLSRFPGLQLSPTTETEGILQFFLFTDTDVPGLSAGIHVYYRDASNQVRRYLYNFNPDQNTRLVNYEHEYTGTPASEYVDNASASDSLVFLQGMAGLKGRITLPDFSNLQNVLINKAELEFYVADLESGDTTFAIPEQLVLVSEEEDGEGEQLLIDVVAADRQQDVPFFFGGVPEEDDDLGLTRYTLNISTYLQQVIDGTASRDISLYPISNSDISVKKRAETAERIVLYGSSHPEYAPVLRLTFTRL